MLLGQPLQAPWKRNANPFHMREPAGMLDTADATYTAVDDRRVRVEGSRFEHSDQHTIKLEGAAAVGFQTVIVCGIRDPKVLGRIDEWCDQVLAYLHAQVGRTVGLGPDEYDLQIRRYGHDAVLGAAEPRTDEPPREVAIVFLATAPDQAAATQLAKLANPVLLHAPLPGDTALPSFALLGSPAEIERGPVHEFVLQHVLDVERPDQIFRTVRSEIGS